MENTKNIKKNIDMAKKMENDCKNITHYLINKYKDRDAIDEREQKYLNEMSIVKDMD